MPLRVRTQIEITLEETFNVEDLGAELVALGIDESNATDELLRQLAPEVYNHFHNWFNAERNEVFAEAVKAALKQRGWTNEGS